VAEAERALAELLTEVAPDLLEECGVGPVCRAQLLVSSGDPSRMRSEASFAALAGTSPVNHHPETSAYYERPLAAGKSTREARRCVKRALARHFIHRSGEIPRSPLTT
jgi:transposase